MSRSHRFIALLLLFALTPAPGQSPGAARQARKSAATPARPREDVERFRARVEKILAGERPAAERESSTPGGERRVFAASPAAGHWGVLVVDAATGETLYSLNADSYFTPASNTKLFTTALALARLGPEHRFRTTLESRARPDGHGRLLGDLVLVGRGDPNLSNRRFPYEKEEEREGSAERVLAQLADALAQQGVKQIEGNIVADDSFFSAERYPSGWAVDDMTEGYGAPVSALSVNDNTLQIEVRPGAGEGERAWFSVEPWAEFYTIVNETQTAPAGGQRRVWAEREPGSRTVFLRGSIPVAGERVRINLAVEEPAEHAAALLRRLLDARGVRIYGRSLADHNPLRAMESRNVLAEHLSGPLKDAVRLINKVSQNLHTEMLLRAVGVQTAGGGDLETSLRVARQFQEAIGIAPGDTLLFDGSGLSRRNLITPRAAVTLLRWAAQQPWAEVYRDSLPVAAQDGTLAERMRDSAAAGRVQAKTGTLGNVNALSGFAETKQGALLVFSLFANSHNLRRGARILDEICIALVEELGPAPPARPATPRR